MDWNIAHSVIYLYPKSKDECPNYFILNLVLWRQSYKNDIAVLYLQT